MCKEAEGSSSQHSRINSVFFFFVILLSAEPAAVTASGVESDISDLPTLMIHDTLERAAWLVIYRGKTSRRNTSAAAAKR